MARQSQQPEGELPPLDPIDTASDAIDMYAEALPEHNDHDIAKATAMREVIDAASASRPQPVSGGLTAEQAKAIMEMVATQGNLPREVWEDYEAGYAVLRQIAEGAE